MICTCPFTRDTPGIGLLRRLGALARRLAPAVALPALFLCATQAFSQATDPGPVNEGYPGDAAPAPGPYAPPDAVNAPAGDPPSRVVRVSLLNGNVSTEPASVNTFSPAELNQVLTTGDRIYADPSAEAELEAGQIALRLGGGADLTVTAMTDRLAQFGLAAGSVHLRSFAIDPGTVLELDTPDAAVTVLQPGDLRVDVDPGLHTTTVELFTGQAQVDSPGGSQVLAPGQRLRLHGEIPDTGQAAFVESLPPSSPDALDSFSAGRDDAYASGSESADAYLNADTTGAADLSDYGSWDTSDFGPIWYPVVAVGWIPYCYGHWRWVAPWGWTWVESEPWGFAPFHYGRWTSVNGRWGWIPGPRGAHPMYAPALVVFTGGPQFSASLGYAPGAGITAWFPLGPREPFAPWYHGSTLYVNRVNASNIFDPNAAEVRGFYNQRAVNVFTGGSLVDRTYANRLSATVAVPESSFAAGRSVSTARVRLSPDTLAAAPLLPHPLVTPERSLVVSGTPRAVPPVVARPVIAGRAPTETPGRPNPGGSVFLHRADPPPAGRPSFDEQREAIQRTDPGRPLSPAQMENLRANRPLGPPPQREAIPHPAPPPPPHSAPPASSAKAHR